MAEVSKYSTTFGFSPRASMSFSVSRDFEQRGLWKMVMLNADLASGPFAGAAPHQRRESSEPAFRNRLDAPAACLMQPISSVLRTRARYRAGAERRRLDLGESRLAESMPPTPISGSLPCVSLWTRASMRVDRGESGRPERPPVSRAKVGSASPRAPASCSITTMPSAPCR